jgi:hypothetical protein
VKTKEVGLLYRVGATKTETVLPRNGKKFSLPELQSYVGGYIELVPCSESVAYSNEEGRLLRLGFNAGASAAFSQVLVGDVIQVSKEAA